MTFKENVDKIFQQIAENAAETLKLREALYELQANCNHPTTEFSHTSFNGGLVFECTVCKEQIEVI